MTLQDQFGKPVLFHWVGWHGKDGQSLTGYDSRDPNVISHQLHAMLALGGSKSGVVALTFGFVSPFIHQAVMQMGNQCNALGMPFALCMDPWTVKNATDKNAEMIKTLTSPDYQFLLNMDCYLEGKPVLDFATGCDKTKVQSGVPGITYLMNGPDFDWPRIPPQPNKTALPCAYVEFDDGTVPDRNMSAQDQSKPARVIPSLGGSTFWSNNVSGTGKYVQFATWNDVKEGTDVEKFGSMLWGKI